jgi:hypothetical protein
MIRDYVQVEVIGNELPLLSASDPSYFEKQTRIYNFLRAPFQLEEVSP